MALPPRPKKVEVTCPHCDGKSLLRLDVEVFGCKPLPPRTDEEEERAAKEGKIMRIVWCTRSYDHAKERFNELVKEGLPPHRIEFVNAEYDELYALKQGLLKLVPVGVERPDGDEIIK